MAYDMLDKNKQTRNPDLPTRIRDTINEWLEWKWQRMVRYLQNLAKKLNCSVSTEDIVEHLRWAKKLYLFGFDHLLVNPKKLINLNEVQPGPILSEYNVMMPIVYYLDKINTATFGPNQMDEYISRMKNFCSQKKTKQYKTFGEMKELVAPPPTVVLFEENRGDDDYFMDLYTRVHEQMKEQVRENFKSLYASCFSNETPPENMYPVFDMMVIDRYGPRDLLSKVVSLFNFIYSQARTLQAKWPTCDSLYNKQPQQKYDPRLISPRNSRASYSSLPPYSP